MSSIVTACPEVGDNIASWLEPRIGNDLRQLDRIVRFRLGGKQAILASAIMYAHMEPV